jgi:hypothetical protein
MQGTGRVGTDELHLYIAAVSEMRPAIIMVQAVYFLQDLEPCGSTNHEVYEPGTGNFHTGKKTISVRQLFNKGGSDISRRAIVWFGESEGDIGGKIAMSLDSGHFQLNLKSGRNLEEAAFTTAFQGAV